MAKVYYLRKGQKSKKSNYGLSFKFYKQGLWLSGFVNFMLLNYIIFLISKH